uniref:[phosphatase 2A protein]-leucine-carboxy methyltransferase n=2 Tax=Lutzomyia longipalpis TaxID=7200 RepID=A0A1B0CLG2_LUTLO
MQHLYGTAISGISSGSSRLMRDHGIFWFNCLPLRALVGILQFMCECVCARTTVKERRKYKNREKSPEKGAEDVPGEKDKNLGKLANFPGNSQRRGSAMSAQCSHPCDEAVIATNDDASECKRSAVRLGYWQDDYLSFFIKNPAERKAPEINRGYFARVRGVEICIEKFLHKTSGSACQIINLGCGFDTLYWRLRESGYQIANFIELDFPTVTAKKCYAIKRNKRLLEKIHVPDDGEVRLSSTDLHASNYHIMGVDLRNIDELQNKLNQAEIDYTIPTIFLAECVLVYIETQNCHNLLKWLATHFPISAFVNYEQDIEITVEKRMSSLNID